VLRAWAADPDGRAQCAALAGHGGSG
jgi:hypothetical protein